MILGLRLCLPKQGVSVKSLAEEQKPLSNKVNKDFKNGPHQTKNLKKKKEKKKKSYNMMAPFPKAVFDQSKS